jgi:hypothetical protein
MQAMPARIMAPAMLAQNNVMNRSGASVSIELISFGACIPARILIDSVGIQASVK